MPSTSSGNKAIIMRKKVCIFALLLTTFLTASFLPISPGSIPRAFAQGGSQAAATKGICESLGLAASAGEAAVGATAAEAAAAAAALAAVPTSEVGTAGPQGAGAGTSGGASAGATANICEGFSEWIFRTILSSLKKAFLDMIVDQTISWIQGGGRPKFLTDWRGFLNNAANAAAGEFIEATPFGFMCSPFGFQVKIGLLPVKHFATDITCTLNQVVSNINNFYNNFLDGGWIGYGSSWEMQNNFYGTYLLALDEFYRQIADAEDAAAKRTEPGGFLSEIDCSEPSVCANWGPNGSASGPPPPECQSADIDGDRIFGDIQSSCLNTTPGDVIGAQVSHALQLSDNSLIASDDMTDYIAAIVNAALNRLIGEGVKGLLGILTPDAPPPAFSGGPPVFQQGGCDPNNLSAAAYQACISYQNSAGGGASPSSATSSLISAIQASITPRQGATASFDSSESQLNVYASTTLPNFLAFFQSNSCQYLTASAKQQYIDSVTLTELPWANQNFDQTQDSEDLNLNVITQLQDYITQINALPIDEADPSVFWDAFTPLQNQILSSGLVDVNMAISIQKGAAGQDVLFGNHIQAASTSLTNSKGNCVTCQSCYFLPNLPPCPNNYPTFCKPSGT